MLEKGGPEPSRTGVLVRRERGGERADEGINFYLCLLVLLTGHAPKHTQTHTSHTVVAAKGRVSATSLSAKETNRWSVWPPSGASSSLQFLRASEGSEGN